MRRTPWDLLPGRITVVAFGKSRHALTSYPLLKNRELIASLNDAEHILAVKECLDGTEEPPPRHDHQHRRIRASVVTVAVSVATTRWVPTIHARETTRWDGDRLRVPRVRAARRAWPGAGLAARRRCQRGIGHPWGHNDALYLLLYGARHVLDVHQATHADIYRRLC